MCGHTYLCKSRHGVYYFRAVVPKAAQARVGRREVRISLRTKNRRTAKILAALKALTMTNHFQTLEPWELEDQHDLERFERGLALITKHGKIDLSDRFAIDRLMEWLSPDEFRDYVFAIDRQGAANSGYTMTSPSSASAPLPAPAPQAMVPTANGTVSQSPLSQPPVSHSSASSGTSLNRSRKPPQGAPAPADDDTSDELVEKAIDRFVDSKKQSTTGATAEKYGAQCRLFLKIVANGRSGLKLSELTPKDLRSYVDTLPRLPTRIESIDPRPIEDILKAAGPTLSPKTMFSHAQATNMFLAWCEGQQYAVQFNCHSILKPLLKKPKIKKKVKTFSPEQLTTLFESETYTAGSFKRASDYWIPLACSPEVAPV